MRRNLSVEKIGEKILAIKIIYLRSQLDLYCAVVRAKGGGKGGGGARGLKPPLGLLKGV